MAQEEPGEGPAQGDREKLTSQVGRSCQRCRQKACRGRAARAHCWPGQGLGGLSSRSPGTWPFSAKMGTFPSKPGPSVTPEDPGPSEPHVLSEKWGWCAITETQVPGALSPPSAAWPDMRALPEPRPSTGEVGTWPVPTTKLGCKSLQIRLAVSRALSFRKPRVLSVRRGCGQDGRVGHGHQQAFLKGPGVLLRGGLRRRSQAERGVGSTLVTQPRPQHLVTLRECPSLS